jgi:NTP pyrophosphatase (non-canonical NTP hydrolase)
MWAWSRLSQGYSLESLQLIAKERDMSLPEHVVGRIEQLTSTPGDTVMTNAPTAAGNLALPQSDTIGVCGGQSFVPLCPPAEMSKPDTVVEAFQAFVDDIKSLVDEQQPQITINGFQSWVKSRWNQRPKPVDLAVMTIGLMGEITEVMEENHYLAVSGGKVAEHIKKEIRGSKVVDTVKLKLELGDVLHYLTIIATHYGISMGDVMGANVDKLALRQINTEAGKNPPPMGDGHPMAR